MVMGEVPAVGSSDALPMPPQDLGDEDCASSIARTLLHAHFGPGSDRAKFSLANALNRLWH
eukprot:4658283-Pyramimonas_sp.AAC.1